MSRTPIPGRSLVGGRARPGLLAAAIAMGMALVGCSSATPFGDTTATPARPAPSPGRVTLEVSGVDAADNLVMVSLIGANLPNQPLGAACDIVRSPSFAFTGEFAQIVGSEPCALASEPIVFDPGTYDVIVAVLPGGSTVPEQCIQTAVTVDGDVTVEVSGLGPPTDCDL